MSMPACLVACSKALLPDSLAPGSSAEAKGIAQIWEKPHTMTTAESHWGTLGDRLGLPGYQEQQVRSQQDFSRGSQLVSWLSPLLLLSCVLPDMGTAVDVKVTSCFRGTLPSPAETRTKFMFPALERETSETKTQVPKAVAELKCQLIRDVPLLPPCCPPSPASLLLRPAAASEQH